MLLLERVVETAEQNLGTHELAGLELGGRRHTCRHRQFAAAGLFTPQPFHRFLQRSQLPQHRRVVVVGAFKLCRNCINNANERAG